MKLLPKEHQNTQGLIQFLGDKELNDLLPQLTYGSKLEDLLHQKERPNSQAVLKWIAENVPEDVREDVTFCRHFVRCVLQIVATAIRESEAQEKQIFKEFDPTLKSLLSTESLQRNCLFETQLFCFNANFPKGLMERIFEYLYSFEIVMAEVFIMWVEDEGVMEGKKESITQTSKWLNKLRQQIEEEED